MVKIKPIKVKVTTKKVGNHIHVTSRISNGSTTRTKTKCIPIK